MKDTLVVTVQMRELYTFILSLVIFQEWTFQTIIRIPSFFANQDFSWKFFFQVRRWFQVFLGKLPLLLGASPHRFFHARNSCHEHGDPTTASVQLGITIHIGLVIINLSRGKPMGFQAHLRKTVFLYVFINFRPHKKSASNSCLGYNTFPVFFKYLNKTRYQVR